MFYQNTNTHGITPHFRGPTPTLPIRPGLPYSENGVSDILPKFWKDAKDGRIFLVERSALNRDELFISCPTTTAEKKMPERTLSLDRRIIWKGRLGDLFMSKCDYYRPEYAQIDDIARKITTLSRAYHGVDILINKRDIKSAFKLVRIHPDGVKLFATEFPGRFFGLSSSVVAFYLVLPFGWSGSPEFFAYMASGIPKWRNAHAPIIPGKSGGYAFCSFLFADDGILIGPNLGTRCTESALCWEKGCHLTPGPDSVNQGKLEEEGNWSSEKLVLGYLLNADSWAISIPGEN